VQDNDKNYVKLISSDLIFIIKKIYNDICTVETKFNPFLIKATNQCKKCGCIMHLKTKLAGAECPVGNW
jgi:hypothetical protein